MHCEQESKASKRYKRHADHDERSFGDAGIGHVRSANDEAPAGEPGPQRTTWVLALAGAA